MARGLHVLLLTGDFERLSACHLCAACGAPSSLRLPLSGPDAPRLAIPYCSACAQRLARHDSFLVSTLLASSLLAVCFALAFPWLWPWSGRLAHVSASVGASLLPVALGWALVGGTGSTTRPSAWWLGEGRLACVDGPFARRLIADNALSTSSHRAPIPRPPAAFLLGPAVAALVALGAYHFHHPRLVVVNLSGRALTVLADGRALLRLSPASAERASSARVLRVPRGRRRLAAVSDAGDFSTETVAELGGQDDHLYAPGSKGRCFWLERTGYGRRQGRRVQPLEARSGFVRIPGAVDHWFSPSPAPAAGDDRSSGGATTALRHARCEDAPRQVRAAVGPGP